MENESGNSKKRGQGDKLDLGLTSIISVPYQGGGDAASVVKSSEPPPISVPTPTALQSVNLEKVIRELTGNGSAGDIADIPALDARPSEIRAILTQPLTPPSGSAPAREKLDLGLADLVSKSNSGNGSADHELPDQPIRPDLPIRIAPLAPPPVIAEAPASALALRGTARYSSHYRQLAEMNRWAEITSECEVRLEEGEDIETKVWWIYSQYKQSAMPISILASPLNEVSLALLEVGGAKDLRSLVSALLLEFSQVLKKNGDFELALSFLERSVDLDTDAPAGAPAAGATNGAASSEKSSIERKSAVRVPREPPRAVVTPTVTKLSASRNGSGASGSLRERSAGDGRNYADRDDAGSLLRSREGAKTDLPPLATDIEGGTGENRKIVWAALAAALSIVILGGDYYLNGRRAIASMFDAGEQVSELQEIPRLLESEYPRPSANPPATERFTRVSQLNALFYDMDRARNGATGQGQGIPASQPPAGGSDTAPAAKVEPVKGEATTGTGAAVRASAESPPQPQLPAADSRGAVAPSGKDVVDTNYPPESDALRMMDRQGDESKGELPQIDFPPYRQGKAPERTARAEAAEVRYPRGRVFTILYRTVVRSAPNESGKELDLLKDGQRVVVVGRVGEWLQLESKRGYGGYILARDADDGYVP
jgi:hypothetical protein